MADVVRARYKGKDTGDGLPHFGGIPARDLHDSDFDVLDDDQKQLVRSSDLYDYVPYTEESRSTRPVKKDTPTEHPANTEEGAK
jgi:hypothetical protein